MNKRIKFLISALLIFAIFVSSFIIPAASYENDIETSTSDIFLVNMDTDTVVFSKKADTNWYAGSLSELTTFLLAYEMIPDPDTVTFKVEQKYIDELPFTDKCLDEFMGNTLTARDLMAIMLLTSGNDAAYALADLASGNDRDAFVAKMNERVKKIGCTSTAYVSPGFDDTSNQYTTCRDLYRLYKEVRKNKFFQTVMSDKAYIPKGMNENYKVESNASIMNTSSPYYFRYTSSAKYSYTPSTYANIALTTTYRGQTYFFAGLLGMHEAERNVYADARKLVTWAYLNLSDHKLLDEDEVLSQVTAKTSWGDYPIDLSLSQPANKTLPNDYDESELTYTYDIPDSVKTPLFKGASVGSVKIAYEEEVIDNIPLSVGADEGLGLLSDFGRFTGYVYRQMTPNRIPSGEGQASETSASGATQRPDVAATAVDPAPTER